MDPKASNAQRKIKSKWTFLLVSVRCLRQTWCPQLIVVFALFLAILSSHTSVLFIRINKRQGKTMFVQELDAVGVGRGNRGHPHRRRCTGLYTRCHDQRCFPPKHPVRTRATAAANDDDVPSFFSSFAVRK
jgi:hypothetical protein